MGGIHVHIIETLKSGDLFNGRQIGYWLSQILRIEQIDCDYHYAGNRVQFAQALLAYWQKRASSTDAYCVLHLSCHGDAGGIGIGDFDYAKWAELDAPLRALNECVCGRLVLSMATCNGLIAEVLAKQESDKLPFQWLIGSPESVKFDDCAIAFSVLYHQLKAGVSLGDAVSVMNKAAAVSSFQFRYGGVVQAQARLDDVQARLALIEKARQIISGLSGPVTTGG